MKVLVAVKRVVDPYVKIHVQSDGRGVDLNNVKMGLNPFDEIAVEEAVRWKEQGLCQEIVVVSIGPEAAQENLRSALAMGADTAILLKTNATLEPLNIAKLLKAMVLEHQPAIVLLGKQAIDDDCNQTGQMLAALLDWPQATFASKIVLKPTYVEVSREVDAGLEMVQLSLPAVITTDLRLNEPRYPNLPNIMKAKKKPLSIIEVEALGLDLKAHTKILKVTEPPVRTAGIKVETVQELVKLLHEKEQVV